MDEEMNMEESERNSRFNEVEGYDLNDPNVKPPGKGWRWATKAERWYNSYAKGLGPWREAGNKPDHTKSKIHGIKPEDTVTYKNLREIVEQQSKYIKKMEAKGRRDQN